MSTNGEPQVDPVTGGLVTQPPPADPAHFAQGVNDAPGGVPAQEGITVPVTESGPVPQGDRLFTAAEVEAARQQEKDKLYGRLESQDQRLARLEAERKAEADAAAAAEAARLEQERLAAEAEMSARELIETKDREWSERFAAIEAEREKERAAAQKEQEFLHLQNYIGQVKAQASEEVLPELLDTIGERCSTQEEVNVSLATAQARTASILQNIAQNGVGAPALPPKGASITAPPVGPSDALGATKTFTAEDIKNMSMQEYQQHRSSLLGSAGRHVADKGLYG